MNLTELMNEAFDQKNEKFVYEEFHETILRCIKNLTLAAEEYKTSNVSAIYFEKGKQKGCAVYLASVITDLAAVCQKYQVPLNRAIDIVLNRKVVNV